jgi:hypothetical protein
MALVQEVRLRSGSAVRACWVPASVREGNIITLKNSEDPVRSWEVTWAGTDLRDPAGFHRGWNNNI